MTEPHLPDGLDEYQPQCVHETDVYAEKKFDVRNMTYKVDGVKRERERRLSFGIEQLHN